MSIRITGKDKATRFALYSGYKDMGAYLLVRTAFHGGGIISKHRKLVCAIAAQRRYAMTDCVCGCSIVIEAERYENLPVAMDAKAPYQGAR